MTATAAGRRVGVVSLLLTLLGAIALLVGMFGVRYLQHSVNGPKFLDFRRGFTEFGAPVNWTTTYFDWAGFTLAGAAFVVALVAALPTPLTPAARVLGALVGLAGAGYTLFMPALDGRGLGDYLPYGVGMFVIAGGFVLLAAAAAIGSRRRELSPAAQYDARAGLPQ